MRLLILGPFAHEPFASAEIARLEEQRKVSASGEWVDKPNDFDVTVWGSLAKYTAKYTAKGCPVAIASGRDILPLDLDEPCIVEQRTLGHRILDAPLFARLGIVDRASIL